MNREANNNGEELSLIFTYVLAFFKHVTSATSKHSI